ncbi:MAG: hypothetical protein A3C53_02340 [Omnitrophica WOR_2 bacterium RIFCSPHIGHO2_02_FULL_68_15]|nr:MAG: hypothetical protein A3C53_02340 [Omnitrophica WOR_2 bacterium RIFCSPHIGHO2_02_FULL_68_15]
MRATRALGLCAVLSLIGIGLAGYLTYLHFGLLRGELLGGAACSGTGAFNCHAVTGGAWGSLLGVPLSLWGILGYVAILALALWGQHSAESATQAAGLVTVVASLFVAADVFLFGVMAFVIRRYCLFCLLTYAVNLLVLFSAWRALAAPWSAAVPQAARALAALLPSGRRPVSWLFWGMMVTGLVGAAGVHAAATFMSRGTLGSIRGQIRDYIIKQPRLSVNTEGDPTLGPAEAPIQLVEFSDFFCPACQRASKINVIILSNHRSDVSFRFKHYPLDAACNDKIPRSVHPGACQVAAASECAHLQGRFWEFHDLVFEKVGAYPLGGVERDAEQLGLDMARFRACLESGEGMEAVKRDIAEAGKIGVPSTPTYVVNGVPMTGALNPAMFEEMAAVLREARR